ncbi:MAG: hypothetical protein ACUVRV_08970 [Cyanobacteriota bacterium]
MAARSAQRDGLILLVLMLCLGSSLTACRQNPVSDTGHYSGAEELVLRTAARKCSAPLRESALHRCANRKETDSAPLRPVSAKNGTEFSLFYPAFAAESGTNTKTSGPLGRLELWANGEKLIREGFVSKDGWVLSFDQVYVTLADITAYQTDPPFDPDSGQPLQAKTQVSLPGPITVNLVSTPEERAFLGSLEALPGHYNALSWRMVPAVDGPAMGYSLWIQGSAQPGPRASYKSATQQGGRGEAPAPHTPQENESAVQGTVDFVLKFPQELTFLCGEYLGEDRKGFVAVKDSVPPVQSRRGPEALRVSGPEAQRGSEAEVLSQAADLEATFHFDHLFGSGELPPEDSLNQSALGFAPFAALAVDGSLDLDWASLQEKLSSVEANAVEEILRQFAHVGEGHCRETTTRS